MVRRRFFERIACGAGIACGLGVGGAACGAGKSKTVTYRIEGFTCVTCAVGLDALLKDQKGIVRSKSSYPERTAVVEYDPGLVNEEKIKAFIQELGFTARDRE